MKILALDYCGRDWDKQWDENATKEAKRTHFYLEKCMQIYGSWKPKASLNSGDFYQKLGELPDPVHEFSTYTKIQYLLNPT